jgi:hypothetical protein
MVKSSRGHIYELVCYCGWQGQDVHKVNLIMYLNVETLVS